MDYLYGRSMPAPLHLTDLLSAWEGGDIAALDAVVSELYEFLRSRAHQTLRRRRQGYAILDTTDLLHELYIKLRDMGRVEVNDTSHFVFLAAHIMRNILVSTARAEGAEKRGGKAQRIALEFIDESEEPQTLDVLIVEQALTRLREIDPAIVQLIELRFFLGMTEEEAAEAKGTNRTRVQKEWRLAKRLLFQHIFGDPGEGDSR
jgi:RNA polymerase sigma factor (TIGR02999 family)